MKREALRVTSTIPVAPTTLYFAWIDSVHHSSMTGGAAKLEPVVGANYSALDGYVSGKLVILDLGRRIVMSWRTNDFPRDAADSRVEVHFETLGLSTRILILHTEIPDGQSERYKELWNDKYISPMRAYFSKFLPDPRNPPVRRPPPPPPENDEEDEEPEEEVRLPSKLKARLAEKKAAAKAAAPPPPPAAKKSVPPPPPPKPSGPGVHKAEEKPAPKSEKPVAKSAPPPAKKAAPRTGEESRCASGQEEGCTRTEKEGCAAQKEGSPGAQEEGGSAQEEGRAQEAREEEGREEGRAQEAREEEVGLRRLRRPSGLTKRVLSTSFLTRLFGFRTRLFIRLHPPQHAQRRPAHGRRRRGKRLVRALRIGRVAIVCRKRRMPELFVTHT